MTPAVSLSTKQRYLYRYYLHHRQHHKNSPCFVPRFIDKALTVKEHLRALDKLEQLGLVSVDRSAPNYTGWIMLPPPTQTFT